MPLRLCCRALRMITRSGPADITCQVNQKRLLTGDGRPLAAFPERPRFVGCMPALTPRLLRRGLEVFALISIGGFVGLLLYGNNWQAFVSAFLGLRWWWLLIGIGLASMDWLGGGTRLWVVARHVHPGVRWR